MAALKQFTLVLSFFLIFQITTAQSDSIATKEYRIVLTGLVNPFTPGCTFEFPKKDWSFGLLLSDYWFLKAGGKAEPFARYYFNGAPKGLFLQTKLTVGAYYEWYRSISLYSSEYSTSHWYASVGAGVALGYQWILPKKSNLVIDVLGGIQASIPVPFGIDPGNRLWTHYYLPGFPLEIGVRLGRAYYKK